MYVAELIKNLPQLTDFTVIDCKFTEKGNFIASLFCDRYRAGSYMAQSKWTI
jgi:hypothetical protein